MGSGKSKDRSGSSCAQNRETKNIIARRAGSSEVWHDGAGREIVYAKSEPENACRGRKEETGEIVYAGDGVVGRVVAGENGCGGIDDMT